MLGSVTERVLRKAPCPVLSVPRETDPATPVGPLFKRILCAVDFSDCSMRALDYAASMAQEADACLTVLHVFEIAKQDGIPTYQAADRLAERRLRSVGSLVRTWPVSPRK